jgi:hypothetical protein
MCRLRHINDPVLSSLKMEGIRLLFILRVYGYVCSCVPVAICRWWSREQLLLFSGLKPRSYQLIATSKSTKELYICACMRQSKMEGSVEIKHETF